jgi:uncharacterized protein YdcH (DUF465 family)
MMAPEPSQGTAMTHVAHDLHAEFADDGALLHRLKLSDSHFQKVADSYHAVNREIHRIESEVEPASDQRLEDLKKRRLGLLDQVSAILAKARTA